MKICTRCNKGKDLTEFGKQIGGKDGLKAWCKRCVLDYRKEHYDQNRKVNFIITAIEGEAWVDLRDYEGRYEISNMGRIKSMARSSRCGCSIPEKILTGRLTRDGYVIVYVSKDNIRANLIVHRHVALSFVPNPYGYPEVNHINGDKSDNRNENLEWCTRSYNLKHAYRLGLRKSQKGILKKAS
jgi:hypothetical protein